MPLFTCHSCAQQMELPELPRGMKVPDGSLTACWRCDAIYICADGSFGLMTEEQKTQEPYSEIVPHILKLCSHIRERAGDRYQDGRAIPIDVMDRWASEIAEKLNLNTPKGFAPLEALMEAAEDGSGCIHCMILKDARTRDFLSSPQVAADYIAAVAKAVGQLLAAAELRGALKPGVGDSAADKVADVFRKARDAYLMRHKAQTGETEK